MSAPDGFEAIVEDIRDELDVDPLSRELEQWAAMQNQEIVYQRLYPGRRELLRNFQQWCINQACHRSMPEPSRGRTLGYTFQLKARLGVGNRAELHVRNPRSLIMPNAVDVELVEEGSDLIGDFEAFLIGPWYDLPVGAGAEERGDHMRSKGLLMELSGVSVFATCGLVEAEYPRAYLPLEHGEPELYKVIRQNPVTIV